VRRPVSYVRFVAAGRETALDIANAALEQSAKWP
jgi:hypothetical protein